MYVYAATCSLCFSTSHSSCMTKGEPLMSVYICIYIRYLVRFINAYNIFTILSPYMFQFVHLSMEFKSRAPRQPFTDFVTRSDESPAVTNEITLSETLKIGHPKRKLVFQPSIFRCKLLVFREGNPFWILQAFSFCFLSFNFPNSPPGLLFCARVSFVKSGLTK